MDPVALLAQLNLRNHSSRVGKPLEGTNAEDTVLQGLSDEQLRRVPQAGMNSIAWVVWHMARTEDTGLYLVGGGKQVFEEGGWAAKMKVAHRHSGTGHTSDEVAKLSREVDLIALRDYRAAVGQRTQSVLKSLSAADLDAKVDIANVKRAISAGAYGESADGVALEKTWSTRTKSYAITVYAITHNVGHWGEITTIKGFVTAK